MLFRSHKDLYLFLMHECKSISWALREGLYVFNLISWNSMGVACGEAFAWVGSLAKIFALR